MSCNCSKMRLQLRDFEGCWAVRPLYRSHQECSTRKGTNSGRSNFVPGATAATPPQLTSTSSTSASSSCLDEKHSIALPLHAHPSLSLPLSLAHVRTHIHAHAHTYTHSLSSVHTKCFTHTNTKLPCTYVSTILHLHNHLSLSLSLSLSFLHTHTLTHTCTSIPTYANKCEGVCEHCCLSATYLAVCSQPSSFSCPQNRTELKRREHSGVRWTLDHDSSRFENWNFSAIAHNNNNCSSNNNISDNITTQETNAAVAENKNWLEVQHTHLVWVWFVRSKTG